MINPNPMNGLDDVQAETLYEIIMDTKLQIERIQKELPTHRSLSVAITHLDTAVLWLRYHGERMDPRVIDGGKDNGIYKNVPLLQGY